MDRPHHADHLFLFERVVPCSTDSVEPKCQNHNYIYGLINKSPTKPHTLS